MIRLPLGIATVILFLAPTAARPQQNDSELLSAILCELKELRASVQQAQVVAPLLEANLRERDQVWKQRADVEERLRQGDQQVQAAFTEQTRVQQKISEVERSGRDRLSEPEFAGYLDSLKLDSQRAAAILQQAQLEQSSLSSESSRIRGRLAELEEESARMQRQLQSLAVASGALCEAAER